MPKTNKTSKIIAAVLALVVMVGMIACIAFAQVSFAEEKKAGLAAHEQVMDDSAAAPSEAAPLAAAEQVID